MNVPRDEELLISAVDKEKLYCELLYTTKHKIGRTIDGHSDFINDLYRYARDAFRMSTELHNQLVAFINDEKPPLMVLLVEIKQASNLSIKDANGFSDPYCMLGIMPGSKTMFKISDSDGENGEELKTRQKISEKKGGVSRNSSKAEATQKTSFLKRFSSFRRSGKSKPAAPLVHNASSSKLGNNKSKIPAKYIQATTVKKATLNPVWNEKFRL